VDRLWPIGLRRDEADMDLWLKDIGPSDELRRWFGHDPGGWNEFRAKFFKELDQKDELVDQIIARAQESDVVLLLGARDKAHNSAASLKEYIETRMRV
jgi:uncharacterized protein YeaO (DUF488 family)